MKNTFALLILIFATQISFALTAPPLNCDSFCVVSIVYDTANNHTLFITIANNDINFINYPIVQLINSNGDTVANQQKLFDFYGQLQNTTQTYHIPTLLDSFPSNWSGQIRLEDGLYHTACIIKLCNKISTTVTEIKNDFTFNLFPNPAQNIITLQILFNGTISFFDLAGRKLQQENFRTGNTNFNVHSFPSGIYLLEVKNNNTQTFKRIKWVKQ